MSRSTLRRSLATALLVMAASLALATPASADVRDQVIRDQSNGFTNILVPDRAAPGSPIRSVPRIGKTTATPPSQLWRRESARNGRGTFNLVHVRSIDDGDRQLCLDVQGDSTQAGAALDGVDPALVGTLDRADGTVQMTLGGWPLYRFVDDAAPGDTLGEDVGGNWSAVARDGKALVTK